MGLGLPAIVRFFLYRRPLLPAEALTWAVALGLVEATLFIALGSQNKTHAVLFLIGWVAYKILRRPLGRFDNRRDANFIAASAKPEVGSTVNEAASTANRGGPDVLVSNRERIGFRFLLIAWLTGALMILASGFSYILWQSANHEVAANLASFQSCEERLLEGEHPACRAVNGNFVTFDQCMSLRDATCGARSLGAIVQRRDDWHEWAELLLVLGAGLLGLPSLLFYVLRWALTGRTRPLWIR
jgi:hypothetical protein